MFILVPYFNKYYRKLVFLKLRKRTSHQDALLRYRPLSSVVIFISHLHYSTEDKRNTLEFAKQLNTCKLDLLLNCNEQNLKMSYDASPIIPKKKTCFR